MIVLRKPAMLAAAALLALTMAPPRMCVAKPAAGSRPSGEAGVSEKDDWARLERDDDGKPLALETAIGSYRFQEGEGRDDVQVDLVGAIHVGDKAYYRGLNKRFRSYDTVLYELVAPDGTVVPRGRGASNDNLLGAMQNGLKSMLELETPARTDRLHPAELPARGPLARGVPQFDGAPRRELLSDVFPHDGPGPRPAKPAGRPG